MPVTVVAPRVASAIADISKLRFVDIGANLTDPIFKGIQRGKRKHADDFQSVLDRAGRAGVKSMIITGGSLKESRKALEMARDYNMFATIGCHPTRSKEFETYAGGPEKYLQALDDLIKGHLTGAGRVVAVGECGLDYDRLHFAPADVQKTHFRSQLSLAKKYHLPLFLHSRAAREDFVNILKEEGFGEDGGRAIGGRGGVVHSFTGSAEEAIELMDMGFHLSVNGCSFKTEDNLAAARVLRPEKLMLETDCPWCTMTSTHASKPLLEDMPVELKDLFTPRGMAPERFEEGKPVKGRNEPTSIGAVAWVIHKLHNVPFEKVVEKTWKNTVEVFGLQDLQ